MSFAGLLLLSSAARAAVPSTLGDITVTEFQADTSVVAQYYGEWFELYNNYPGTLDFDGVTITNSDSQTITISGTTLVAANGYLVLGVSDNRTYGDADFNGNVPVDIVYSFGNSATQFNMAASADSLTVSYGLTTLDEVVWDSSWGVSVDYAHSASLNAYHVEWANDFAVNWCASATFITVSGMYGSPGEENEYCGTSAGVDNDKDGFSEREGDCRDDDANINPDSLDGNDGVPQDEGGGGNADDDADCDRVRDDGITDEDGDGSSEADGDCDDTARDVYPDAAEVEDGEDNDCNDCIDDLDQDGDTFGYSETDTCGDDCSPSMSTSPNPDLPADADADVNPDADEVPYDGYDQDCDGFDLCDYDEDGYDDLRCGECTEFVSCDCDDNNVAIHPNAIEDNSDGIDNDCDGDIDVPDRDGDGYTEEDGDCMDVGTDADDPDLMETSSKVHPGATEVCGDQLDNDCDGFYDNLAACANPASYATVRGGGFCGVTPASGGTGALALAALLGLAVVSRRREGGSR